MHLTPFGERFSIILLSACSSSLQRNYGAKFQVCRLKRLGCVIFNNFFAFILFEQIRHKFMIACPKYCILFRYETSLKERCTRVVQAGSACNTLEWCVTCPSLNIAYHYVGKIYLFMIFSPSKVIIVVCMKSQRYPREQKRGKGWKG